MRDPVKHKEWVEKKGTNPVLLRAAADYLEKAAQ